MNMNAKKCTYHVAMENRIARIEVLVWVILAINGGTMGLNTLGAL